MEEDGTIIDDYNRLQEFDGSMLMILQPDEVWSSSSEQRKSAAEQKTLDKGNSLLTLLRCNWQHCVYCVVLFCLPLSLHLYSLNMLSDISTNKRLCCMRQCILRSSRWTPCMYIWHMHSFLLLIYSAKSQVYDYLLSPAPVSSFFLWGFISCG